MVASGALYFLAFPGVGLWPLGFIALVPLILALRAQPPARAVLLGWFAGFVVNALGLYWLVPTLRAHAGLSLGESLAAELALGVLQGGRLGLLGWLVARGRTRGWPFEIVFLVAFAASEFAWPGVFPWSLGAVLHDVGPLLQSAELLGPTGVGLLLVAANLAVAEPLDAWLVGRRVRRLPLLALAAAVPLAAGLGVLRMRVVDQRTAAAETAVVALVQPNLAAEQSARAWEVQLSLSASVAGASRPDLIVWSEALPGQVLAVQHVDEALRRIQQRSHGIPTLLGVQLREVEQSGEVSLYNSVLLASANARGPRRYDKQRLLPFAERLPLGASLPTLPALLAGAGGFVPGSTQQALRLGERALAVFVCYESTFPGLVRDLVGEADLLVNLTNDAWFGDTTEPEIHLALAKFRAVEHRRFLVRATNSGISAVIDATGRVVSQAPPFTSTVHRARIHWLNAQTPFGVWGETPLLAALALASVFAFVPAPRPSRARGETRLSSSDS